MIDTREIVGRLHTIESIAVIPRVASTNLIARRIVQECIGNELSLPQAMIIAREQFAGRGRNQRVWSSPRGKGIYATTLISRPAPDLGLMPLIVANIVASYLSDVFGLEARIKWPNDVLIGTRKIAGILIEARVQDDRAFILIGTGVNVEQVEADDRPNAISIREASRRDYGDIDSAIVAFIEHFDERLSVQPDRESVLEEWRQRTVHRNGDRISCTFGERTVSGTWEGIDEYGRALLRQDGETIAISAGDLIVM